MDDHKSFLVRHIEPKLTSRELQKLVYLFDIPEGRAENVKSVIDLLKYMEEKLLLQPGKYDELRKAMETIERFDLVGLIDKHIKSKNNNGTGIQESASGESSNIPSSALSERPLIQPHFEKEGNKVSLVDGKHFCDDGINLVEMKVGNTIQLKVSTNNANGYFVDIGFPMRNGENQGMRDIRVAQEGNETTITTGFMFQGTTSSGLIDQEYVQLTFFLCTIYFQDRKLGRECQELSTVMHVHISQAKETKVHDVLEWIKNKYPTVVGSYLHNGERMLRAENFLSLPSNNGHSEKQPLLLLKESERIFIKQHDGSQPKYIDVDPLQCSLETIQSQAFRSFGADPNSRLEVDGKVVEDYMECFKGNLLTVTRRRNEQENYFQSSCFRDLRTTCARDVLGPEQPEQYRPEQPDEDLNKLLCGMEKIRRLVGKEESAPPRAPINFPARTATSSDCKTGITSEDKTIAPPDQVVITIFLVPKRSP